MPRRAQIRVCVAGVTGWTGSDRRRRPFANAADLDLVSGVVPIRCRQPLVRGRSPRRSRRRTSSSTTRTRKPSGRTSQAASSAASTSWSGSSGLSADDYFGDRQGCTRPTGRRGRCRQLLDHGGPVLLKAAVDAARHLDAWEVDRLRERQTKPDAPSGTARELAERLAEVRAPAQPVPIDDVLGQREARGAPVAGSQVHSLPSPELRRLDGDESSPHRGSASQHPARCRRQPQEQYVAGTLLAIRGLHHGRTGLTRGLERLLGA